MFIAVTPIGSSANDVSAAAKAYVDYLCGGGGGVSESVGYYAAEDTSLALEGAGQWSCGGADYLGLHGAVDRADFSSLLQGRHHETAERLISARGSAGRMHLKAGQPTRLINGRPVWGISDIAARLRTSAEGVASLVDPGLMMTHDRERYLDRSALHRLLLDAGELSEAMTMERLVASNDATISSGDLAEAVGVTRRHIREVCKRIDSGEIEDTAGLQPVKVNGEWQIDRLGAMRWAEQRKAPAVRVGFDLTLTTEKSLSVFGLLGDADVRRGTMEALANANDEALRWLTNMASTGRSRGEKLHSHGLAVASFMHSTSRNDDPFLHIHNVVLNAIVDEHGVGRALDATGLYAQAPAAAALATAAMRRELTDRFGVDWRLSGRDTWEIAGIEDEVLESFSSRRKEIEQAINDLYNDGDVAASLVDEVAASTRTHKQPLTADELTNRWNTVADDVGFDAEARASVVGVRPAVDNELNDAERAQLWRWIESPEGVAANSACFDTGDVYWSIANWAPNGTLRLLSPNRIISEAHRWQSSDRALMVGTDTTVTANGRRIGRASEPTWTTARILELQQRIATQWHHGRGTRRALVPAAAIHQAAARSDIELSQEQRELIRAWATSGDAIQAAIGRPGTGKTTAMAAAADAWSSAGFVVKGAAVKGEAARILGKEAGIESTTVANYLASHHFGNRPVDARTVLIVDEASTLSEWDLGSLIDMCTEAGATLRLIGDPAQHTSVQAGGSWAQLVERFATETPELRNQRRLKNPAEVEVTELIRGGDFSTAFTKLAELGNVQEFDGWSEAYAPIIQRWWSFRQQGRPHPLVERTNANRQVLNSLAQAMRHRAGELGDIIAVGTKTFAVGDEVIAKAPNRELRNATTNEYIRNGSTGIVTQVTSEAVTVDFDDLGAVSIPSEWAKQPAGLDLAYAVTSYSIQGRTTDVSTSVVTEGLGAPELMVDLTRGREENVLVAIGRSDEEFTATPDSVAERVADTVRIDDLRTVDERDPVAIEVHRSGLAGLTLAEIASVASGHRKDLVERAVDQRVETLRLSVRHETPYIVHNLIGPRPSVEWRAARWRDVATEIVVFHDRWPPLAGANRTDRALARPTDDVGRTRRAQLDADVSDYRQLQTHAVDVGL